MDIEFNNKIFIINNQSDIKSFFQKFINISIFCNILLNKVTLLILMLKILM